MSTLANITSLNVSLQTGGAALAVKAVKSVAKPERVVYVFGTADDVAPNFTTASGAYTYALSLTPTVTEPVVIRLFTKADGTPYTMADFSMTWREVADENIFVVSDFVRLNTTTDLPNFLPVGFTVWYIDANGVETLWVGREDGSAWPAVGYKEYVASVSYNGATISTDVRYNTLGSVVWTRNGVGDFMGTLNGAFASTDWATAKYDLLSSSFDEGEEIYVRRGVINSNSVIVQNFIDQSLSDVFGYLVSIKVFP